MNMIKEDINDRLCPNSNFSEFVYLLEVNSAYKDEQGMKCFSHAKIKASLYNCFAKYKAPTRST